MSPQWPWILHLIKGGQTEEWPQSTFIHSMPLDCEGGVDVFSQEMTALFEKLKSGETPTTPRSTYEVCLYLLKAMRHIVMQLSNCGKYLMRIDYQEGKLMKLIDRKSINVTFSYPRPQSMNKSFFAKAARIVCCIIFF